MFELRFHMCALTYSQMCLPSPTPTLSLTDFNVAKLKIEVGGDHCSCMVSCAAIHWRSYCATAFQQFEGKDFDNGSNLRLLHLRS